MSTIVGAQFCLLIKPHIDSLGTKECGIDSEINTAKKDVEIPIAKALAALDNIDIIWNSDLPDNLRRKFFRCGFNI